MFSSSSILSDDHECYCNRAAAESDSRRCELEVVVLSVEAVGTTISFQRFVSPCALSSVCGFSSILLCHVCPILRMRLIVVGGRE